MITILDRATVTAVEVMGGVELGSKGNKDNDLSQTSHLLRRDVQWKFIIPKFTSSEREGMPKSTFIQWL